MASTGKRHPFEHLVEPVTAGTVDRHSGWTRPGSGIPGPRPTLGAEMARGELRGVFLAPGFGEVPILGDHDASSAVLVRPSAIAMYLLLASASVLPTGRERITNCSACAVASSACRATSRAEAARLSAWLIASAMAAASRLRNGTTEPVIAEPRWRPRSDRERRRRRYGP